MTERSFSEGFRETQSGPESDDLLAYLNAVAAVPAVRDSKTRATELLDIAPGERVLEVGCGTGADLGELLDAVGPDGHVVGLDPNASALEFARERFGRDERLGLNEGHAERLPFESASFDACRADRTLQHATDVESALTEIERVLRPGGRLVVLEMGTRILGFDGPTATFLSRGLARSDEAGLPLLMPLLLGRAGFEEVRHDEYRRRTTSIDDVMAIFRVPQTLDEAARQGTLDPKEIAQARRTLERSRETGSGVSAEIAITSFIATAPGG